MTASRTSSAATAAARAIATDLEGLESVVKDARSDAGGASNAELADIAEALARLDAELNDADGSYPQPMLLGQINYLLGMTSRADQAPGQDAYTRHEELRGRVEAAAATLETLQRRVSATSD